MRFSIIVPVYNVSPYLEQCVFSVLHQTYDDFEIIAINDGSNDNSIGILRELEAMDSRIRVWDRDNQGLSVTRNFGVHQAKGDYIVFLDGDDLLNKSALQIMDSELSISNLDMLMYGAQAKYDLTSQKVVLRKFPRHQDVLGQIHSGRELYATLIMLESYYSSACFYAVSRGLAETIQFVPDIYYEDTLYTMQLLMNSQCKRVKVIDDKLYVRRVRDGSITTIGSTEKHVKDNLYILNEMASCFALIQDTTPSDRRAFNIHRTKVFITALKHSWDLDPFPAFAKRLTQCRQALEYFCGIKTVVLIVKILCPRVREYLRQSKLIDNPRD
jgi:glycosyltransferase involved in cell wall biosynthesis